jgi:rhamnosyltransferase
MKDKVAIILCTFNGSKFIKKQINSIFNQNHRNFSLFVFDDNSNDGTFEILTKLKKKIFVSKNKKRYGNAAQNFFAAIKKIKANNFDYFAFSDQDDEWYKFKIKRAINILKKKYFDGYSSNVIDRNIKNKKRHLTDKSFPQRKFDYIFEGPGPGLTHVLTKKLFLIIKKKIIHNNNIISKIISHDWFFYCVCRNYNLNWFIDRKPTAIYNQHDNNEVGANWTLFSKIIRLRKIIKGDYLKQIYYINKYSSSKNFSFLSNPTQLSIKERFFLISNIGNLRRNLKDRFLLFFLLIFFII